MELFMGMLLWFVLGVAAGSMARWIMPGPPAGGIMVAIGVGLAGAFAGGLIGTLAIGDKSTPFDFVSLLMAIAGLLISLFAYRALAMRLAESDA
ncbi:MAG: GlsB/YeaQ/YmgE family stress response membrane protein [Pirellulales bacterium]|nr:GlsB/YeaQ/YmgE family stress response membrane protein [Pirellulales bacterium]